ncbi:MAG: hypothetical protein WAK37_03165, partial [Pseudolabrys sp.]
RSADKAIVVAAIVAATTINPVDLSRIATPHWQEYRIKQRDLISGCTTRRANRAPLWQFGYIV